MIDEFKLGIDLNKRCENSGVKHHGVQKSSQETFVKQTKPLVVAIEETGNSFMEDSNQLFSLDTKDAAGQAVVETVRGIELLNMEQYESFTKGCLIDRKTSLSEPIKKNKLALFSSPATKKASSSNHQLTSLESDIALYITTLHLLPNKRRRFVQHEN